MPAFSNNTIIEREECLVSVLVTIYSAPQKLNEADKRLEEKLVRENLFES
jgi:hypothetical protein